MKDQDRRAVEIEIGEQEILEFVRMTIRDVRAGRMLRIPIFEGIPADAYVDGVEHDPAKDLFVFRLTHPSFPLVPVGKPVTIVPCDARLKFLTVE